MVTGIDIVGATSLGTGTTKTLIGGGNLVLPAWARSIVAIMPVVTIDTPTAGESVVTKVILESDDSVISPFEVPAAPIAAILGATGQAFTPRTERYLVNAPVNGGDQVKIYGQALVANTVAPDMSVAVVISDQPPAGRQRFAKMGTLTNTGTTTSTDVSGTAYSFSKSGRIVELLGVVAPTTVAASDSIIGYLRYSSSEFVNPTPLKLPLNGISGGLSTLISPMIDGVSRAPVDVPTKGGQVNIQDYLNMQKAPDTTGNFVSGLIFE